MVHMMSRSSYDELLTQIEGLKSENSHLCRELQDNSSHLTKLENEASNMKDVLSHIHLAMADEEGGEFKFEEGAFFSEENGAEAPLDANLTNLGDIDQDGLRVGLDSCWSEYPSQTDGCHDDHERTMTNGQLTDMQEIFPLLQELDQERNSLVEQIETEEHHRQKYYEQLEMLSKKLESLPLSDTYNLQTDMARRQIEYEAKRLEEVMVEKFGTNEQVSQRQEARIQRIRSIENEMVAMQDKHRHQLMMDKLDPSSCDLKEVETSNGVFVKNAFTNTALCGEVFILKNGAENSGYVSDRGMMTTPTAGQILVNIATQTADVVVQENPDILQANLPHAQNLSSIYHGSWPLTKDMSGSDEISLQSLQQNDLASVMSFNSAYTSSSHSSVTQSGGSGGARNGCPQQQQQQQQNLGTKVEMVYSLLSMLGTHDKDDMSRTLLAMSSSQDSCIAMRQSGCLPLLIQLLHGSDKDSGLLGNTRGSKSARARAAAALHNIVHSHPDDKRGRREARVLRLLEQIRAHCDQLRGDSPEEEEEMKKAGSAASRSSDMDHHPGPAIAALMKLSFDEEHRHAICTLGGLQAIAELMQVDNESHGNTTEQYNVTMRRYACMALTNLTFGDGTNKALLCSMKGALEGLVAQLRSTNEDLCQVAASVLRNLSWRADLASKKTLREVGAVMTLMESAMCVKKESTLKSILSALWNLSAHCTENKADICAVENSLAFLVSTLTYKSPSKTMAIIENGGGVLRNVSSHVAVQENYRKILRQHGCLQLLLKHLRSTSLTIVSNACGTLWNLSARCTEDQQALWDMGAVSMLRNLVHSKHKMISMGSAAALKNLLSARPSMIMDLDRQSATNRPGLHARKVRALEQELDQNLAETCDNVESPRNSPTEVVVKKESVDVRRFVFNGGGIFHGDSGGIFQSTDGEPRRPMVRGHIYPGARSSSDHGVPTEKICSPQRGVRSGSDERPPMDSKLRSPHRVARSGSQDSVGSTHSDISHDRTRVHNMLAKSSRLLNGRQGGSLDRNKDSLLHRFDPDTISAVDRARMGMMPNSRIIQVMQEVAMHAGIDTSPQSKDGQQVARNVRELAYQSAQLQGSFSNSQRSLIERFQQQKNMHFVPNSDGQSAREKNVNLGMNMNESDEPINYSLKCPESCMTHSENDASHNPAGMSHNTPRMIGHLNNNNNSRPQVKVGNFVGPNFVHQRMPGMVHNRFVAPPGGPNHADSMLRSQPNVFRGRRATECHQQQLGHYAETDLDSMDEQPTNFSLRYAEHNEDGYQDQPINYSMRYEDSDPHCADCKLEEARRTNERLDEYMPSFLDDQVKTFYTEGTPYLSTATSLTDLTGKVNLKDEETQKETDNSDELQNFASKYSESEKDDESDISGQREATAKKNFSLVDSRDESGDENRPSFHSHDNGVSLDQTKTYCQEGTPICFSRVSSLSSLHSSEARDCHSDSRQMGLTQIQELDKMDAMTGSVIENIGSDRQKESPSKSIQSPGAAGSDIMEKEHKTVTFDENNLIEETPLMFSRCSSLGSLSSFDAQSVHSSVVSEYSRRASEVVSPSELPDSPSETMPPSPKSERKKKNEEKAITEDESIEGTEESGSRPTVFSGEKSSETCLRKPVPNLLSHVSCNGLMEAPKVYAEEGTPPTFSETASLLSAITMDDDENGNKTKLSDITSGSENKSTNKSTVLQDDKDSSMSEVSEGEEDILAQCISSAMPAPNNSSRKMRKSSSDQAIKKKSSGLSKIDNLGTSKSKLPTKVMNKNVDASNTSPPTAVLKSKSSSVVKSSGKSPKSPSEGGRVSGGVSSKSGSSSPGVSRIAVAKRNQSPKMVAQPQSVTKIGAKSPSKVPLRKFGSPVAKVNERGKRIPQNSPPAPGPGRYVPPDDCDADTVKTYAEEGTPLNFSNATSLSDLSVLEVNESQVVTEKPNRPNLSIGSSQIDDSKSDNSSLCEDNDEILSQLIQAAMPKSKVVRRLDMDRQAQEAEARRIKAGKSSSSGVVSGTGRGHVPIMRNENPPDVIESAVRKQAQHQPFAFQPQRTSSQVVDVVSDLSAGGSDDAVKTYNEEGTPLNFSNATSLSDLTIDSTDGTNHQRSDLNSVVRSSADNSSMSHVAAYGTGGDNSVFQEACDSPKIYAYEGTPLNFSRSGSLSSLSVISGVSEDVSSKGKSNLVVKSSHAKSSDEKDGSDSSVPKSLERQVIGQSSEESSIVMDDMGQRSDIVMGAKQGPSAASAHNKTAGHDRMNGKQGASAGSAYNPSDGHKDGTEAGPKDEEMFYHLEGTPAAFSMSSSLSELSIESTAFDPTPDEQALLEECISSAMPKSRSRYSHKTKYDSHPRNSGRRDRQKQMSKSSSLEVKDEKGVGSKFNKMSHSCSDAGEVEHIDVILTRESRYSSWKKTQAQKSLEEGSSESEQQFTCRRSYSHDSSLSKERKDSANKEIASMGNQKSLPQDKTGFEDPEDYNTIEEVQRGQKFATVGGLDIADSYSSEKFDSEKSETDDSYFNIALTGSGLISGSVSLTDQSVEDLMKVSLPKDLVVDTDDDALEMDPHFHNEADDTLASETAGSGESTDVNTTVIYNNVHENGDVGSKDCSFEDDEISPEDELLLEENASLVVSELVTNRAMHGSTCEDDFIENETLSLISNDYMSDTASEISVTWSVNSEKVSEYSGSTLSQTDSSVPSQKGPKIVKPGQSQPVKVQLTDDEKAIRGRKKPLYSKPVKPPITKTTPPRSVKPPSGVAGRSPSGRIPPGGAKKISPKSNLGQRSQSQGPPASSTPNKPPIKPKISKPVAGQQRSISTSGITRSPLNKTTNPSRLPTSSRETSQNRGKVNQPDRPKPLIKQGTFTKTSTTAGSAPTIEADVSGRPNADSVRLRDKRANSGNRNSGGSSVNSQRGSGGSAPEAWSKALDGFNFIVEKDVGSSPPYKQIQMQRNAKDATPAVKRTVGAVGNGGKKPSNIARPTPSPGGVGARNNLQKTGSASNLKKMGGGSSLTKTLSGTSLTKTASGSSLAKTGSGSSLVKTSSGTVLGKVGSNSNLKKFGSREFKKSESNASIKSDSRPTTPSGRRASSSSVTGKKTESTAMKGSQLPNGEKKTPPGVVGKKQVSSKIAGLWKKDDSDGFPSGSKLPVSSAKGGKSSSLPPSIGRGTTPRVACTKPGNAGHSETVVSGIKKSSTYDKLSTKNNATSVPLKSKDEDVRIVDGMESDHYVLESENDFDISAAGDSSRADLSVFGNDTMKSEISRTRESSICSVDSLDGELELDSGTYKKKKTDNSLNLPNADETCRSMPGSVSNISGDTSLKLKPGKWRRYKDDSAQKGDIDPDVWIKQDQKSSSKENKSKWKGSKKESKSVAHSITQFFGKKFGSQRNSNKDGKKKKEEVKVHGDMLKPPPPSSSTTTTITKTAGLRSECRTSPSAIVPPFNYSPPVQPTSVSQNADVKLENKKNDLDTSLKSGLPTTHMTKTEMLLARRRRSYLNSSNQLDESSASAAEDESKRGCLVTTV
ncbi:LOW QUALITY PROTEIN: adenomatous polyposis coli protein-like [Gigantopelta aegis]|uniref:LOW QUALITY PROTEIN: adenomatous polyposis coli protein-like n=1 Tax=Gigantopelta aegis TaxID=1735272 RepID=UPI001B88A85D|nr:LOW QUALITY PROTEIN: adenomatous polyposis coli protein-like [Gigantopelta aegis]